MTATGSSRPGGQPTSSVDSLHVVVELLSELDAERESGSRPFYDRICEAVCRLTSLTRAGLFLYDRGRELVVPAGSHGVEPELLALFYGTLDETPAAQQALADDSVVTVADMETGVPGRYAHLTDIPMITCAPVAAGGRWLGVIFADRGGDEFTLTDEERQTMWMLGKTAALAASARTATAQGERARALSEHIRLAREVHEQVMQRLFGVSMALGTDRELTQEERARCAEELQTALGELREALARSLAPEAAVVGATLREELARLGDSYKDVPLEVTWERGVEVPSEYESIAVPLLAEALRNAEKHARPTVVEVRVGTDDGAFLLEIRNDGVAGGGVTATDGAAPGAGLGLRLATLEAVQRGGVLEFGAEEGTWRVRLVLPLPASS